MKTIVNFFYGALALIFSAFLFSCTPQLASGNYLIGIGAGNETQAMNYLGKAGMPMGGFKKVPKRPGSVILMIEESIYSNRMLSSSAPSVITPPPGGTRISSDLTVVKLANANLSYSEPMVGADSVGSVIGGISYDKFTNVKFKIDSVHKIVSIGSNASFDFDNICEISGGIYTGKIQKESREKLNYIQKVFQISGQMELKVKNEYQGSIKAQVKQLPPQLKANWQQIDDGTYIYNISKEWSLASIKKLEEARWLFE